MVLNRMYFEASVLLKRGEEMLDNHFMYAQTKYPIWEDPPVHARVRVRLVN